MFVQNISIYFDVKFVLCKNIRFKNNCFDPLNKILRISQICVDKGITKILWNSLETEVWFPRFIPLFPFPWPFIREPHRGFTARTNISLIIPILINHSGNSDF